MTLLFFEIGFRIAIQLVEQELWSQRDCVIILNHRVLETIVMVKILKLSLVKQTPSVLLTEIGGLGRSGSAPKLAELRDMVLSKIQV